MKIRMITESVQVNEKLGNLAQLKLGNLANLLKQDRHNGIGDKFTDGAYGPGNTSKVIDAGQLKKGISGLRKAYRDFADVEANNFGRGPVGFALYLDNSRAVVFGLFNADKLAGNSREGRIAYDLSDYKDAIQSISDKENADLPSYRQRPPMKTGTAYDKPDYHYPDGYNKGRVDIIRKFVGEMTTTGELAVFLTKLEEIAALLNKTITMKLVTSDTAGNKRGNERRALSRTEVEDAAADLRNRLIKFKNAKRPTADTIHQFLEMVTRKAAGVINFGGRPWKTTAKAGYDSNKIDPVALMSGKPFTISYNSADPNDYGSITIYYRYEKLDNTIKPWKATWAGEDRREQLVILDPAVWVKDKLNIQDLEKPTVIRKMLTMIKDSPGPTTFTNIERVIKAMRDLDQDWPEFGIIEKSIAAERAKEAQK